MSKEQKSTVPGQYLGFSLQVSRMLVHLLRAKRTDVVSLELFGDTGVEHSDGVKISEEAKSRIGSDNPIADRSVDLWKTFRNWIRDVELGRLDANRTVFRLYLTREFDGRIAHIFNLANSEVYATAAYEIARAILWDEQRDGPVDEIGETVKPFVEFFFRADRSLVVAVLTNFELEFGSGETFEDIRSLIAEKFVSQDKIDLVMDQMLGWIKRCTDERIAAGLPAIVSAQEFIRMSTELIERLNQRGILQSFASTPKREQVDEHLLELRRYIKQLELIEIDEAQKIDAVVDYMKAEADRTHWAAQLRVLEPDIKEYETELFRAWRAKRQICSIRNTGGSEILQGLDLYSECSLHRVRVAGEEAPDHFGRGSLHELANRTEEPHIGWHPRYSDLLAETGEDSNVA